MEFVPKEGVWRAMSPEFGVSIMQSSETIRRSTDMGNEFSNIAWEGGGWRGAGALAF